MQNRERIGTAELDASQAYTHVSIADDVADANLAVAGTHKWLGVYFPLGVAISPKISSSYAFDATISNARQKCLLDDSLLTFVEQIDGDDSPRSETVNLGPNAIRSSKVRHPK